LWIDEDRKLIAPEVETLEHALVYGAYAAAGLVGLAVYSAMPKEGRPARRGLVLVLTALALGGLVILLGRLLGDWGGRLYFYVLSLLAVVGGVRVVTHRRPLYSALYFVMVVLSTAALMVLVGAEFLGAALVIVYAGAILVTYVFVIMLAQQSTSMRAGRSGAALDYDRSAREPMAAVLAGFVLVAVVGGVIVSRDGPTGESAAVAAAAASTAASEAEPVAVEGNTLLLGRVLLKEFAVSVELAGVLLMVAMIGAIAIARKPIPHSYEEEVELPPPGEIGKRVKPF
jgi:NADH-quinone oxidoreductase subunit J